MSHEEDDTRCSRPLDYYDILNVKSDVDSVQLKKAYRIKVLEWHPDKNVDKEKATNMFRLVREAFEVLSDDGRRRRFDESRKRRKRGGASSKKAASFSTYFDFFRESGTNTRKDDKKKKKKKDDHDDGKEFNNERKKRKRRQQEASEKKRRREVRERKRERRRDDERLMSLYEDRVGGDARERSVKVKWSPQRKTSPTEAVLRDCFDTYGSIERIVCGPTFAKVTFESRASAERAIWSADYSVSWSIA